jgi:hypothetical protein
VLIIGSLLVLAGCGGTENSEATRSSVTRLEPHSLPEMREAIWRLVDANLVSLRAPAKMIACVHRNVEKMSARQIAERLVESGPPHPRSVVEYLGPLGIGCP